MTALRPREHGDHPWSRVTIVHLQSGQQQAYADHIYVMEITFTGGTPANERTTPGMEIPYQTMPPYRPMTDSPGVTVIGGPSDEEREAHWTAHVKERIKVHHGWSADKTTGEIPPRGSSYLKEFGHVRGDAFSNTYRVTVVAPYMD